MRGLRLLLGSLGIGSSHRQFKKALEEMDNYVLKLVSDRRRSIEVEGSRQDDMLDMLLRTRFEGGDGFTDREIRDELVRYAPRRCIQWWQARIVASKDGPAPYHIRRERDLASIGCPSWHPMAAECSTGPQPCHSLHTHFPLGLTQKEAPAFRAVSKPTAP